MEVLKEDGTCFDGDLDAVKDILKNADSVGDNEKSNATTEIRRPFVLSTVSKINDHLYLSSAAAVLPSVLEELNVSCVINVASELPDTPLHDNSIVYYKINVLDDSISDLGQYFDGAADLIQNVALSGGKTLVHCVAGISRSASVCIAYLMKYHGLSLLEAYNDVKLKRPLIRPNCAFFKQLMKYENSLYGCTSVAMVYNEYLKMEIPDVYDSQYQYLNAYRKKCRSKIGRF